MNTLSNMVEYSIMIQGSDTGIRCYNCNDTIYTGEGVRDDVGNYYCSNDCYHIHYDLQGWDIEESEVEEICI